MLILLKLFSIYLIFLKKNFQKVFFLIIISMMISKVLRSILISKACFLDKVGSRTFCSFKLASRAMIAVYLNVRTRHFQVQRGSHLSLKLVSVFTFSELPPLISWTYSTFSKIEHVFTDILLPDDEVVRRISQSICCLFVSHRPNSDKL